MDREAWSAVIHGVTNSRTRLSDWTELSMWKMVIKVRFTPINITEKRVWLLRSQTEDLLKGIPKNTKPIPSTDCWENWSSERLSHSPIITQQVSHRWRDMMGLRVALYNILDHLSCLALSWFIANFQEDRVCLSDSIIILPLFLEMWFSQNHRLQMHIPVFPIHPMTSSSYLL